MYVYFFILINNSSRLSVWL